MYESYQLTFRSIEEPKAHQISKARRPIHKLPSL